MKSSSQVVALLAMASLGTASLALADAAFAAQRTSRSPSLQTPEQFVSALYRDIADDGHTYPLWWRQLSVRTRALHARLRAAEQRTGQLFLSYDWVCGCQDPGGLALQSVTISDQTPSAATATVRFRFPSGDRRVIRLRLVHANTWMVDDIEDERGDTFRDALARGLRAAERPR